MLSMPRTILSVICSCKNTTASSVVNSGALLTRGVALAAPSRATPMKLNTRLDARPEQTDQDKPHRSLGRDRLTDRPGDAGQTPRPAAAG